MSALRNQQPTPAPAPQQQERAPRPMPGAVCNIVFRDTTGKEFTVSFGATEDMTDTQDRCEAFGREYAARRDWTFVSARWKGPS